MPSPILQDNFGRIEEVVQQINHFAPIGNTRSTRFRAELAGLLTVYIVAHYENCVKDTMISFAGQHDQKFADFVERQFSKLNSKISARDLRKYGSTLDPIQGKVFKERLDRRRKLFSRISGSNVETQLDTLLSWRHEYAHSGQLVTTVEEALKTHRLARIPIQTFEEVFSEY